MSAKRKNPVPAPRRSASPATRNAPVQITRQVVKMEHLPPELLERFEQVVAGSAQALLSNTLKETEHRRAQQNRALEANIALQQQALARQDAEVRNSIRSDLAGQRYGFIWNLCCLGAAVALAWFKPDMWKVALGAVAMPAFTVAVKVVIDSRHLGKTKSEDSHS